MLIDEKGKLFGKVNIIDLTIVLVIVVAFAGAYYKFSKANVGPMVKQDNVIIKFIAEEASDYAADAVKDGDVATDDKQNLVLGKVVGKPEIGEALTAGVNSEGEYVQSSMPGKVSAIVTVEGKGVMTKNGVVVNGVTYGVGHTMVLRAGKAKLWVKVYDMGIKE